VEFPALGAEIPALLGDYEIEAKISEKVDWHQSKFNARFPRQDTTSRYKLIAMKKWIGPN
jgi:hypothetical protein